MSRVSKASLDGETRRLGVAALDLLAKKLAEDEKTLGIEFPVVTAPDGHWLTAPASESAGYRGDAWSHGNWHCGFLVGLHLAAHVHTGDPRFLLWAKERLRLVAQRAEDPNTHDIGFIFDSSAIPAFFITQEQWSADVALRAAARLRGRLVTTPLGAYISAWGPISDPRGRRSSAIDTMANLPLLFWAADASGDASFRLAADAHAAFTRRGFVRDDYSTFHAVEYDERTGSRVRGYTFQGFADGSAWSRGQTWAIYGYAQSARETRKIDYLELADQLVAYYLKRLGDDPVPPWDFDAPRSVGSPRDSAAAAIAASALFDLSELHPRAELAAAYRRKCVWMVRSLCADYLAHEDDHRGLLKHGCYSNPHKEGVDSATMFGDFYFVEVLCKLLHEGRFRPASPAVFIS
ncbi:MAG: glycoside hydrolase family 88 protein [Casimicrobiaceae bacterium]